MVITNLACYEFIDGEMTLTSLHPSCSVEDVHENTGWEIRIAAGFENNRSANQPKSENHREELDPKHLYI